MAVSAPLSWQHTKEQEAVNRRATRRSEYGALEGVEKFPADLLLIFFVKAYAAVVFTRITQQLPLPLVISLLLLLLLLWHQRKYGINLIDGAQTEDNHPGSFAIGQIRRCGT